MIGVRPIDFHTWAIALLLLLAPREARAAQVVSTFMGEGHCWNGDTSTYGCRPGVQTAANAQYQRLKDVVMTSDESTLYLCDQHRILKVDVAAETSVAIAGQSSGYQTITSYGYLDATGTNARGRRSKFELKAAKSGQIASP